MVNEAQTEESSLLSTRTKTLSLESSSSSEVFTDSNNNTNNTTPPKRFQSEDGTTATSKERKLSFDQFRSLSCPNGDDVSGTKLVRMRWKWAARNVRHLDDPWAKFNINSLASEKCIRHQYNSMRKEWYKEECVVKMDPKKFAQGAMRACYRLKKQSKLNKSQSWSFASNYVAKCYMDASVPRERYFDEVRLQMDAKLWAEIYNQHNPPKKIDMFQMSILEFVERPDAPLYHLEHFIEGNYTKYNSNSGFVDDAEHIRFTPQAFSHFTFECSNHQLMVVDIQGVGDLYTDPQIHTACGADYGDGNLGLKGFALFFATHYCSDLCKSLGLTQFDLAPTELKKLERMAAFSKQRRGTQCRGSEEQVIGSLVDYFGHRIRNRSSASEEKDEDNSDSDEHNESARIEEHRRRGSGLHALHEEDEDDDDDEKDENDSSNERPQQVTMQLPRQQSRGSNGGRRRRMRYDSANAETEAETADYLRQIEQKKMFQPRASCVYVEKDLMQNRLLAKPVRRRGGISARGSIGDDQNNGLGLMSEHDPNAESILGRVHLEMTKYYEVGRFSEPGVTSYDEDAAFFHLEQAANLGVKDAIMNIAKIHLQLPHTVLVDFTIENSDEHRTTGFNYMLECAEKKDKNALFFCAKAFDTGSGLGADQTIDWSQACEYYQQIVDLCEGEEPGDEIESDCDPTYLILARMAEMYMKGGANLEPDYAQANELYSQAAEKATHFGKGRLANKYYMLAEEASSMIE